MRSSLLSLAAVSCLAAASAAQAADLYFFPEFAPVGAGNTENQKVKGAGALIYDDTAGTTVVMLSLKKLAPNTTYGIMFGNDLASAEPSQAFTTDSHGNASFMETFALPMIPSASDPFFLVYLDLDENNACSAEEVRAAGIPF